MRPSAETTRAAAGSDKNASAASVSLFSALSRDPSPTTSTPWRPSSNRCSEHRAASCASGPAEGKRKTSRRLSRGAKSFFNFRTRAAPASLVAKGLSSRSKRVAAPNSSRPASFAQTMRSRSLSHKRQGAFCFSRFSSVGASASLTTRGTPHPPGIGAQCSRFATINPKLTIWAGCVQGIPPAQHNHRGICLTGLVRCEY